MNVNVYVCVCIYMKHSMYRVQYYLWFPHIHWESWNISPTDKGGVTICRPGLKTRLSFYHSYASFVPCVVFRILLSKPYSNTMISQAFYLSKNEDIESLWK